MNVLVGARYWLRPESGHQHELVLVRAAGPHQVELKTVRSPRRGRAGTTFKMKRDKFERIARLLQEKTR